MVNDGLKACEEKMRDAGVPDAAIATFAHYYEQLESGETGMLPDDDLDQLSDVPSYDDLPDEADAEALDKTVVIKLNGGLGTSMGMEQAKSLLEVKEGKTFLDIIAGQVLELRKEHGARLPLVLMNSFATRDDTLEALEQHPELESDVPADFVQNKEPKITVEDRFPVEWPDDPASSGARRGTATSTPRCRPRARSTRCSSAATSTRSSPTPTTSARCSTRGC